MTLEITIMNNLLTVYYFWTLWVWSAKMHACMKH